MNLPCLLCIPPSVPAKSDKILGAAADTARHRGRTLDGLVAGEACPTAGRTGPRRSQGPLTPISQQDWLLGPGIQARLVDLAVAHGLLPEDPGHHFLPAALLQDPAAAKALYALAQRGQLVPPAARKRVLGSSLRQALQPADLVANTRPAGAGDVRGPAGASAVDDNVLRGRSTVVWLAQQQQQAANAPRRPLATPGQARMDRVLDLEDDLATLGGALLLGHTSVARAARAAQLPPTASLQAILLATRQHHRNNLIARLHLVLPTQAPQQPQPPRALPPGNASMVAANRYALEDAELLGKWETKSGRRGLLGALKLTYNDRHQTEAQQMWRLLARNQLLARFGTLEKKGRLYKGQAVVFYADTEAHRALFRAEDLAHQQQVILRLHLDAGRKHEQALLPPPAAGMGART